MNTRAEVLDNLGYYGSAEFTVRKQNMISVHHNDILNIDSHIALVREDTNQVLSVVGKGYNPVDHVDAFKTAENVIQLSDLNIEGIERRTECSHGGARAYSIYTLPEHRDNLGRNNDSVSYTHLTLPTIYSV